MCKIESQKLSVLLCCSCTKRKLCIEIWQRTFKGRVEVALVGVATNDEIIEGVGGS